MRIGQGYDVHALVKGRNLILGGVTIPFEKGLAGHSDADVLVHAVCDALLGAAALGDIGRHFPDNDPRYKNADSRAFLREVGGKIRDAGFSIANVDATIVAKPRRWPCTFRRWSRTSPPISRSAPTRSTSRRKPPNGWGQSAAAKASPPKRSRCSSEAVL